MEPILSAQGIVAGYRERKVLHKVSLDMLPGESVLLIGPNGCGKTTLLKVLAGVLRPEQGRVLLKGTDISRVFDDRRALLGFGYLMQTQSIFPSLTVDENLHLSFWHRNGNFKDQREYILSAFPMLKPMLARRAGVLSGGERQALAIGMVLMRDVDVLLLDEPTAGLSPKAAATILQAVHDVKVKMALSTVIVEHNLRLVHEWVSRVLVMNQGRIVAEERDPSVLLDHERLQEYYFG